MRANKTSEPSASVVTTIRLSGCLLERLDQAVDSASSEIAPGRLSRSAMVRELIVRGLDSLSQEAGDDEPPRAAIAGDDLAELARELMAALRENTAASTRVMEAIESASSPSSSSYPDHED